MDAQSSIATAIKLLGNKGYNPAYWLHDQDINGAWYGPIGASVALFEQPDNQIIFRDKWILRDEQDAIETEINNEIKD